MTKKPGWIKAENSYLSFLSSITICWRRPMHTRRVAVLTLSTCWLLLSLHAVDSLDSKNVSKAKDFMKDKMIPQAIALLEKEINGNLTNIIPIFKLGISHINKGQFLRAYYRFASSVALTKNYGYKIGNEYMSIGSQPI